MTGATRANGSPATRMAMAPSSTKWAALSGLSVLIMVGSRLWLVSMSCSRLPLVSTASMSMDVILRRTSATNLSLTIPAMYTIAHWVLVLRPISMFSTTRSGERIIDRSRPVLALSTSMKPCCGPLTILSVTAS